MCAEAGSPRPISVRVLALAASATTSQSLITIISPQICAALSPAANHPLVSSSHFLRGLMSEMGTLQHEAELLRDKWGARPVSVAPVGVSPTGQGWCVVSLNVDRPNAVFSET